MAKKNHKNMTKQGVINLDALLGVKSSSPRTAPHPAICPHAKWMFNPRLGKQECLGCGITDKVEW